MEILRHPQPPEKCRLCTDMQHNIRKKKCTKRECEHQKLQYKLAAEVKLSMEGCFICRKEK